MDKESKQGTVNMLLDITHFTGESEGRALPWFLWVTISAVPAVLYFMYGVLFIPFWVYIIIQVLFSFRIGLITIGDEKTRLHHFKRQLYGTYSEITEHMDIKTIHENGMIEYNNGQVAFSLMMMNRGSEQEDVRSGAIANLISQLNASTFDIRIYNVRMKDQLFNRYSKVHMFKHDERVARDYLETVDYIRDYTEQNSLITLTVFVVYDNIAMHEELYTRLKNITQMNETKLFKMLSIANREQVYRILAEDFDTDIDIDEIQRAKYFDKNYFNSSVVGYDIEEVEETEIEESEEERGFMVE